MFKSKPPNQSLEYLLALEKFRDLMVKQMSITAAEDLEAKLMTRKLEVSNAKLKAKMAGMLYTYLKLKALKYCLFSRLLLQVIILFFACSPRQRFLLSDR